MFGSRSSQVTKSGFLFSSAGQCQINSTGATVRYFNGDTQPGQSNTYTPFASGSIYPVSARLEADADNDGFGDESQDQCPTDARTQGACPSQGPGTPANPVIAPPPGGPDSTKPALGGLSFSSTVFKAAYSGDRVQRQEESPDRHQGLVHPVRGRARSSSPSSARPAAARVAGKCRTRTRKNRKKPKCTLLEES